MITKSEITVEQKLEVYACDLCDHRTSHYETAATHYALNHLPRRSLGPRPVPVGDGWFVANMLWCATREQHRLMVEARAMPTITGWIGPAWYATIWRVRRDSECGEVTEHRVESITALVKEATERFVTARQIKTSLGRLAAAGAP